MHRTVIDEDLIIECIREARQSELETNDDENNNSSYNKNKSVVNVDDAFNNDNRNETQIAHKMYDDGDPIDFIALKELSLSFRDIYKIDHLRGFENVVQLRLDNNLIERIENLEHMIHLEWLDLSFNNISKIEGLDQLTKLKDLCLVNNFIQKIENLQNNSNLEVLSLANNCIESIDDNILYLREFEHLEALNLKGNPIYDKTDFKVSIFAFCQKLKFLDYVRIKESDILYAKNEKKNELDQIEEKEYEIKNKIKKEKDSQIFNELLSNANISGINTLFEDMIRDDSEMIRLQNLPGFEEKINEYKIEIQKNTKRYIDSVIIVYNEKKKEDKILEKTLKKVSLEYETYSINIINKFINDDLAKLTQKVLTFQDQNDVDNVVKNELKSISDVLMESEIQCVEKINFILNVFEDRITDLMKKNLNNAESYFAETQSLQNDYNHNLLELISSIRESIKQNGIDSVIEALPENEALRNMILDKESMNNSITLSHDNHISHIGRLEDTVRDREEKEKKEKMEKQNNAQYKRNRQRISEILIFVEKYQKQFNVKMN